MNLVEATHDHVEFDTLRSHYKSSMENLIKTIQLAVNNSNDDLLKYVSMFTQIYISSRNSNIMFTSLLT